MTNKPSLASVLDYYCITYHPDRVSQKIHCPVHEDAVSSCSINLDEEEWWKCFACGKAGDSLTLIMEREGCDFVTAVKFAAGHSMSSGDTNDGRVPGLLGRSRPERRNGRQSFRPRFVRGDEAK